MFETQHPTSPSSSVDIDEALESVDGNQQRLFEIAETFRQDAPKLLVELADGVRDGKWEELTLALNKLYELAKLVKAKPLVEIMERGIIQCERRDWSELTQNISTLETTIQGIINLLRERCLLIDTNRLPEAIEFPDDKSS